MKKAYVIGLKWFDSVNGNTYNNALVMTDKEVIKCQYGYGYGDNYFYKAKETLQANGYDLNEYEVVDMGYIKTTHSKVKKCEL